MAVIKLLTLDIILIYTWQGVRPIVLILLGKFKMTIYKTQIPRYCIIALLLGGDFSHLKKNSSK